MKYWLISIMLLSASIPTFSQGRKALWEYDLDFFRSELAQRHYNLFANLSRDTFNQEVKKLKAEIDQLTDVEIALRLQQIVCKAKDSHSRVGFSKLTVAAPVYPIFNAYWYEDGIFIQATTKDYKHILAKRILAINDLPIETVVERLQTLFVVDNEAMTKKNVPWMLNSAAILSFLDITDGDKAKFTLADVEGKKEEVVLPAIEWKYDQEKLAFLEQDSVAFTLKKLPSWFWKAYFPDDKIMFVQYNRCDGKEVRKKYYKDTKADYPSFKEFAKTLIKELKQNDVDKLVFDMRFNGGGSSRQGTELIEDIAKLDLNGKQKIYVLIGRQTFSSAILNTLDFKRETDAILLGEPTGGMPNHLGEVRSFVLPNNKLKIRYSTKYFKKVEEAVSTIVPDVEVKNYFNHYRTGVDPVWEYIKKIK